jgi:hypothetical protein
MGDGAWRMCRGGGKEGSEWRGENMEIVTYFVNRPGFWFRQVAGIVKRI